jgi:Flp pilus assembly protein TadG
VRPERLRGGERGAAATELVLVTPLLLLLLVFATLAGRLAGARGDVVGAARDGARAASIARSADAAGAAAQAAAEATMLDQDFSCSSLVVDVDDRAFVRGGTVAVRVSCDVALRDLSPLPLPGTRTVSADAVEVVDEFRGLDP